MNILMVASECTPFVKVGGLADVVGTLPRFLRSRDLDVRIVLPKYRVIDDERFGLKALSGRLLIPLGGGYETAIIKEGRTRNGIPVYFIENARYFDREEVYRTADGDYADNRERFIFFSRAVLEAAKYLSFQPEVIHCHDWQAGIIPAYLKTTYRIDGFFLNVATVYTVHNIAYQGIFDADTVDLAGLSWNDFTWDKLEYYDGFNFMKAGLVYADMLSTVSPTYAREIQSSPHGRGMEGILRSRSSDLMGILNGIDYSEWNPSNDPFTVPFSARERSGKALCKQNLQELCQLPANPDLMLIGAVSRLDPQKGYDLVAKVLPDLMKLKVQMVILGAGDRDIQALLTGLAQRYPKQLSVNIAFNNEMAHKIYAGADVFLMPSRFEPCGLGQMIALAYGTIPIVNSTGGLADTITNFNLKTRKGNGFVMAQPKASLLKSAVQKSLRAYQKKEVWNALVSNAFAADFSWEKAVDDYMRLYNRAIDKRKAVAT